ncbi:Chondroitin [Nesidiocoris tenuis]|nr:Chondroitin [Nesidiocoris tenuis]
MLAFAAGFLLGHILLSRTRAIHCDPSDIPTDQDPQEDQRNDQEETAAASRSDQFFDDKLSKNRSKGLLFVGVMTAQKYLDTRATAVYRTWGRKIPGKIMFFSSEGSAVPQNEPNLPLVALPDVDDSYPPQKKSFLMLKHMWDNYGRQYEWFLRADDDVYIRPDKIESFLRTVDSRRPLFIGQAGRGNQEEFGLLSLEYDENFCMGGPGVIMSRSTLSKVAQHVGYCLKNLYTTHEDVELGRCVQKFAGISCTWSYEMQTIFYHNGSGNAAFTGDLKKKEIHRAITLHPIKDYRNMYRIHNYMKMLQVRERKYKRIRAYRDMLAMVSYIKDNHTLNKEELRNATLFGQPAGVKKFRPPNHNALLVWEFIQRSIFSPYKSNPRMRIGTSLQEGLDDVVREVMEMINMYSKQRGRVIDFKEILYGYTRQDPLHGIDYILDMLLVYRKYRGRKMTVPVRRHAYIQQQFAGIAIREVDSQTEHQDPSTPTNSLSITSNLKEAFDRSVSSLGRHFPAMLFSNSEPRETNEDKTIHFILPLSGRFDTFRRFVQTYETECLKTKERASLTVVLYPSTQENTLQRIIDTMKGLQKQYPAADLKYVTMYEEFARAKALSIGASHQAQGDLLFFVDVDIAFRQEALRRIRQRTVQGRSVYYPIVFSEFDPGRLYGRTASPDHFAITGKAGYWRQYGFGICSIYKEDLDNVGGLNTTITGWGKEDVDLFERIVRQMSTSRLQIFRAPDPDIIHIYHPVTCDPKLNEEQLSMCKATRADTYGSAQLLEEVLKGST